MVASEGQVIDGNNKSWPTRLLDSYSALLLEGSEGTAAAAVKPTFENWQLPLVDIRVDHSSPWGNLVTETNRRPSLIPIATASANLVNHAGRTGINTHGATPEATANQIVVRDENGRAKIASPAAADDIARKDTVETHAALTNNPHSVSKNQVGLARVQNIDPLSWTELWIGAARHASTITLSESFQNFFWIFIQADMRDGAEGEFHFDTALIPIIENQENTNPELGCQ